MKAVFSIKTYRKILRVRKGHDNYNICGITPDCGRGIYQEYGLKYDTTFRAIIATVGKKKKVLVAIFYNDELF